MHQKQNLTNQQITSMSTRQLSRGKKNDLKDDLIKNQQMNISSINFKVPDMANNFKIGNKNSLSEIDN